MWTCCVGDYQYKPTKNVVCVTLTGQAILEMTTTKSGIAQLIIFVPNKYIDIVDYFKYASVQFP